MRELGAWGQMAEACAGAVYYTRDLLRHAYAERHGQLVCLGKFKVSGNQESAKSAGADIYCVRGAQAIYYVVRSNRRVLRPARDAL